MPTTSMADAAEKIETRAEAVWFMVGLQAADNWLTEQDKQLAAAGISQLSEARIMCRMAHYEIAGAIEAVAQKWTPEVAAKMAAMQRNVS
jgi:hypothetical protein